MAKQKGIIKLEGTMGDITFLKTSSGYEARQKTSLSKEKIASDPSFVRLREQMSEFSRAAKGGSLVQKAFRTLVLNAKDSRLHSRLLSEGLKVIKADTTHDRGSRTITDGQPSLLERFEFNNDSQLSNVLGVQYSATIDRATGDCTCTVTANTPTTNIEAPAGTTHYKVVSAAAAIDFDNAAFTADVKETAFLPYDGNVAAAVNLASSLPANSTLPLMVVLGIQFYEDVNGNKRTNKDGNALAIVKVDA